MAKTARVISIGVAISMLVGAGFLGVSIAQTNTPDEKVILRVGTPSDMVSPNPFKACCGSEYEMMFMAYDMLFNFGKEDLQPVPGLAKECTPSSDNMTWTCDIRSGVKWSDGQPLTAADIAFTYNFILDNGLATFKDYLPFSPTFTAPDDTTLVWKTEEPTFAPNIPPWVPIVPEHVWSKYDGQSAKEIKAVPNVPAVGSGPFVLQEWKEGQFWRMTANHDYWGGDPTIDEVVFQVFDNREAMVQALKSKQVDFIDDLTPTLFNSLQNQPNIALVKGAPSYFDNLAFNFGSPKQPHDTHDPAVENLAFRQAIAHAIDKQAIVDKVWQGDATVGSTITLPGRIWHHPLPADQVYPYDPEQAKQLLDQAGYVDKDGDGWRDHPDGSPLDLNILTINSLPGSNAEGELMAAQLKQVGIKMTLEPVSESKAYDIYYDGDYDGYIWDWGGDPDPDFILSIFTTSQCLGWSDGCYSNKQYDKMYEHQRTIFDKQQRNDYVAQMQQFVYKEVPEVVTVYPNYLQAYRTDTFTGYVPMPTQGGTYLFNWGPLSYINLKPVSGSAGTATSSGGVGAGVWIGVGVALVVVVAAVALTRRRRTEEEA